MASELGTVIERFVMGDASSDELVAAGEPVCRRFASRLVEPAAVDDVVQESLIELLATADRLRHPGAAPSWLWLIVRKQAERHRRRLRLPLPLDLAAEFPATGDGPEAALLRAEQNTIVRRALQAARDPDRHLLTLRYAGDWTDAELADLLGVTPGAVRKRLHDARQRLRPVLNQLIISNSEEPSVPEPTTLEPGTIVQVADLEQRPTPSLRPARSELLPTGLRVIDALVPIREGGTVDFLGPVGTGHLVLMCEIARNLSAHGPTAVVAVASAAHHTDRSSSRLHRLIEPDGIPELSVVINATGNEAVAALAGAGHAARLARTGTRVLLCIDRFTCDHLDPAGLAGLAGVSGPGSVTVIRVAPHARDAEPAEAWPLECTITLSLERMSAAVLPAVDVLASRSSLIDNDELDPEIIHAAAAARSILEASLRLDRFLDQPLHAAEAYTGTPGQTISPSQARSELETAIGEESAREVIPWRPGGERRH